MGMEGLLSVSLSCSFAPLLITTYLFFSFSAAAADSRGPHLLRTFRQSHANEHTRVSEREKGKSLVSAANSRSGVGDVFLEGGQRNLALDALRLRLSAQVNVHHVASQSLQTSEYSLSSFSSHCQ